MSNDNIHPTFAPFLSAAIAIGQGKPLPPVRYFCTGKTLQFIAFQISRLEMTGEQAAAMAYELHGALVNSVYIKFGSVSFEATADKILAECRAFAADVEEAAFYKSTNRG